MEPKALFLFGAPQLTHQHSVIHIGRKKALGLLAYLAASDHPHTRDHLATFFWPDHDPSQAYAELRRTLSVLRQALGDIVVVDRETVCIPPDSPLRVDVRIFQNLINAWRSHCYRRSYVCEECFTALKTASEIYRDQFLAGFSLEDGGQFDSWQTEQERSLRDLLNSALDWLSHYHSIKGDMETAIATAQRWLSLDTLNEPAHVLLMWLYAKHGQRAAAVRQFEECKKLLLVELGLPPQTETIRAYQSIRDASELQPAGHQVAPTSELNELPLQSLPFQTIPYVTRERIENDIEQFLKNPACRLLTLTGPGGNGKSRLAIEIAKKHIKEFPDGVYFVRLAACESAAEIVPLIGKALRFTFGPHKESGFQTEFTQNVTAKQQLFGYLHNKTMLIILDNFEHLKEGVDLLIDILDIAPQVLLLVTSRIRLDTIYEYVCPVPGLDLPDDRPILASLQSAEDIVRYNAVRFFDQCARMTVPHFELNEENLTHVLRICRAVRGMPLGILLATAWLAVLSPQEICAEIEKNYGFLETTLYGLPDRQRSMRAVFNHTWKLLTDREQTILKGLSVFRGGFSRQAAGFITGASLSDLKSLANKWLVERDHQGRFLLHELLRQYLAERLEDNPDEKTIRKDKHLRYFTNYLHERSGDLEGYGSKQALSEIDAEIENIQEAWNWALQQRDLDAIQRSLEGLAQFYEWSARYMEGESSFARAIEIIAIAENAENSDPKNGLLLGKLLVRQGLFRGLQGLERQTREALRKGLDLLQGTEDRKELAYALLYLAVWATTIEEEKILLGRALRIFTDLNERKGIAYVHTEAGYILFRQGEFQKAKLYFSECLEIHRELANRRDIASGLNNIGYIHWIMGDYLEAYQCFQESLEIHQEQNEKQRIADTYNLLALVFASWKDYAKSKEFIWKRFKTSKETGNLTGLAIGLTNIAECELMEGNDKEANRLAKESYLYYKMIDEPLINADWYFRVLGESECGLGNLTEGKMHLRQALNIQVKQKRLAATTHTLIGAARYFERIGHKERAFELLGLAMNHDGSWQWVKDRAITLVEKFKLVYPPEIIDGAIERGKILDLSETVNVLLCEFTEENTSNFADLGNYL